MEKRKKFLELISIDSLTESKNKFIMDRFNQCLNYLSEIDNLEMSLANYASFTPLYKEKALKIINDSLN